MTQPTLIAPTVKPPWSDFVMDPEPVEDHMQQELPIDDLSSVLRQYFWNRPDVFASGAAFICWDPNDRNRRVVPDFYIALNVNAGYIRTMPNYLAWEIGKIPDFALEVASPSTAHNDCGAKRDLYAQLGVTEYWRFDPTGGELYGLPIIGERLMGGQYQAYPLNTDSAGNLWAHSEVLNLDFYWTQSGEFQVFNRETGQRLNTLRDEHEARLAEREARLVAEAETARLLAELESMRGQQN